MFFGKKKTTKCANCSSKVEKKFNFCPFCGEQIADEDEAKDFGILGKDDFINEKMLSEFSADNFGIADKLIGSIMGSMMRSMNKQLKNFDKLENMENARIEQLPNGIKISIGMPLEKQSPKKQPSASMSKKEITKEQIEKMAKLPRVQAKTKIARLADKIVCEIDAPGVSKPEDIFISKTESGYEIKAIGKSKIYSNSIPLSHPLKGLSINGGKILVEFKTSE